MRSKLILVVMVIGLTGLPLPVGAAGADLRVRLSTDRNDPTVCIVKASGRNLAASQQIIIQNSGWDETFATTDANGTFSLFEDSIVSNVLNKAGTPIQIVVYGGSPLLAADGVTAATYNVSNNCAPGTP